MLILYKYLFYGYSYYIKKYDWLWDVREAYYVGGALFVGLTINTLLYNIYRIAGILWDQSLLHYRTSFAGRFWPFLIPFAVTIYLGVTGKHRKIYKEIANLPPRRKRLYKVLNIVHLVLVFGTMFVLSDYIRYYINGGDSALMEWVESW